MQWTTSGHFAAHSETAQAAPWTAWYMAEGSTSGFNLYYLIQNATGSTATVQVTYMLPAGAPVVLNYSVPANSRYTIDVNTQPGLGSTDVASIVGSTNGVPIIVERAMYRTSNGVLFNAGHGSAAVPAPALSWFFAEGATGSFFDEFITLANPSPNYTATLTVNYLLSTGSIVTKAYSVAPRQRRTLYVDSEDPALANASLSAVVNVTNGIPIVAERTMWWPGPAVTADYWYESHNVTGTTATGRVWLAADGEQGGSDSRSTYVLVANPNAFPVSLTATVLPENGGALVSRGYTVPANARLNIDCGADFTLSGERFSLLVDAGVNQIVVERSMYWTPPGAGAWAAGTANLATRLN